MRSMRNGVCVAVAGCALGLMMTLSVKAQLVLDGETISTAQTLEAARKEERLVHYGIYPVDQMSPILKAFEADTGVKAEFVRLPAPNLFNRVLSEYAANKLEADSLDISDLTLIKQMVDRGILAVPHKVPSFAQIPDDLKDADGRWYAVIRILSSAIVANLSRVKEADVPKDLKDILDPKWKGIIGITSIDAGASSLTMDAFLMERLGVDYGQKLAALSPKIYPFIAPLVTDISRGEIGLAVGAISEQALAQMKAGAPLKLVFAPQGVSSFASAAGVTSSAKHPNAAKLLLDWMTSKRGGKVITESGAYPANPGGGTPRSDLVAYPAPEKIWNMRADKWADRDTRMPQWREIFGVK